MVLERLTHDFYYHFFNGTLTNAYEFFGAHIKKRDNEIVGCEFLLYAPNANKVCLIGEFNNFEEIELKEIKDGFYYIYINHNIEYSSYKYVIKTKEGKILYKADPYAFYADVRPSNNSKVYDLVIDDVKYRRKSFKDKPISIYEMHIGSWNKNLNNYNDIKIDLIKYLIDHKFTHVEFLPLTEHPLDDSWGYMTTGYYCATSRYGKPSDLKSLIDELHKNNIGVILDVVPGHICRDDFGLYKFDDTYLYEYESEFKRENYSWGTANLDLSKGITKSFLVSFILFWIKYYKIDGIRVDAVSNLIYYLGKEENGINIDAINFLRYLNKEIKKVDKNIVITAEDSSAYKNVTNSNGLGFDFKWNMGWMNDTLTYFKKDPLYRKYHHDLITFSFTYCFNEKYILPISHDEVVHMKNSLFNKMCGNDYEKFSNLKLFFGYMFTHPGKKLLFMGQEFAVYNEWDFKDKLDFNLYNKKLNFDLNCYYKDINKIYCREKALFKTDNDNKSFNFIEANNKEQSVFIYSREYINEYIVVILNALPVDYSNYKVGVRYKGVYKEILNSDNKKYGGKNHVNSKLESFDNVFHNLENTVEINLPSLSVIILKHKIL
ncbi:MAG: 1,4-alpha-glucan branching protein GlgB [bacterium]